MSEPERVELPKACERYRLSYQTTRYDYLRGLITGGRDESGHIMLDVESVKRYAQQRRARRLVNDVAETPCCANVGECEASRQNMEALLRQSQENLDEALAEASADERYSLILNCRDNLTRWLGDKEGAR